MPRKKRIFRQNYFHHVMFRGIDGRKIFINNHDCARFCIYLQEASEKHNFSIHGFCLMSNHVHLIIEPLQASCQLGMHAFSFRYAQYFNRSYKRKGYLFQGRFKSILVEDGVYLKRLLRYIHLNPVEAHMVQRPENFKWSSYRSYLEHNHYVWLQTDRILREFGKTRQEAVQQLVEYTHQKLDAKIDSNIISKMLYEGGVFESDETLSPIDIYEEENRDIQNYNGVKDFDWTSTDVVSQICCRFNVTIEGLSSKDKSKHLVDARSLIAFITRHVKKWTLEEVAVLLNKNSGTLSRLATRAQNQPELIAKMSTLFPKEKLEVQNTGFSAPSDY